MDGNVQNQLKTILTNMEGPWSIKDNNLSIPPLTDQDFLVISKSLPQGNSIAGFLETGKQPFIVYWKKWSINNGGNPNYARVNLTDALKEDLTKIPRDGVENHGQQVTKEFTHEQGKCLLVVVDGDNICESFFPQKKTKYLSWDQIVEDVWKYFIQPIFHDSQHRELNSFHLVICF